MTLEYRPAVRLLRTNPDLGAGVTADQLGVIAPAVQSANGTVTVPVITFTATKGSYGSLSLVASTPQNIDFTALSAAVFKGDLSYASVVLLDIENTEAVASGRSLTVGAEGTAAEWYDPIGPAAGARLTIPPGARRTLYVPPGGTAWAVGTRKLLKLDPGANPVGVRLIVGGA